MNLNRPEPTPPGSDALSSRERVQELAAVVRELAAREGTAVARPSCFVSYAWGDPAHQRWVQRLAGDLREAGIEVLFDLWHSTAPGASISRYVAQIEVTDWILAIGTPLYRQKTDNSDPKRGTVASGESDQFSRRLLGSEEERRTVIPVLRKGGGDEVFPPLLRGRVFADMRADGDYDAAFFDLLLTMYRVPFDLAPVIHWRRALRRAVDQEAEPTDVAPLGAPQGGTEPAERTRSLHNLPQPRETFVGREAELSEIETLLAEHRLVTLTGVGGAGKSRLGAEVARRSVKRFRDGVWLTALAGVADELLVPRSVAASLGLKEQAAKPPTDILATYLADREVLLVLDNCEHLVEACALLVDEILQRCPDVTILATSRRPVLRSAREHLFDVSPLRVPPARGWTLDELRECEAVRFFIEIGRGWGRRHDFDLTPDNAAAVVRICRQLDGIPLAIQLAAARLEHLSCEEISHHLERAIKLLKRGGRTEGHHQSLQATLDWSYGLLPTESRTLFARLGIFTGGGSREDVLAVCADDPLDLLDLLDPLETLVNHSLVRVRRENDEHRYSMHEVVRQYSRLRLRESGEEARFARRHRDRYLDLAESASAHLLGEEQGRWLARLEADHPNLRQALKHSLEAGDDREALQLGAYLWRFWEIRTYFAEGRERLAALIELPVEGNEALWAEVAGGAGTLAYRHGDLKEAERLAGRVLEIQRRLGNDSGEAEALNDLGIIAGQQGLLDEAFGLFEESLQLKRAANDERQLGVAHNNLGGNLLSRGRVPDARKHLQESLERFRAVGNSWETGFPLYQLGLAALFEGDAEEAHQRFAEALEARSGLQDKRGIADALTGVALTEVRLGDPTKAREPLERALDLRAEVGDRPGKVRTVEVVAAWAVRVGQPAPAAELLAATERFRRSEGLEPGALFTTFLQQMRSELDDQLDPASREEAWQAGETLDLDRAVKLGRRLVVGKGAGA